MTDKEKIIAEIERLKNFFKTERKKTTTTDKGIVDKLSFSSKIVVLEELLVFINSLPDKKPSEDLEEAAKNFVENNSPYTDEFMLDNEVEEAYKIAELTFKRGAQWQKEQIMESAIDAKIVNDEMSGCVVDCEQGCLVLEPHRYPIGQKLKLLIIKEDEQ